MSENQKREIEEIKESVGNQKITIDVVLNMEPAKEQLKKIVKLLSDIDSLL